MPVKIRLMRIGSKGRPFYRVVAVDERRKRTGGYLDLLGTYNPLTEPKEIKLNQEKIDDWVKKGAQMSEGFLRIIGKAPQRPPRKPKKERKQAPTKVTETKPENETEQVGQPRAETIPTPMETTKDEDAEQAKADEVSQLPEEAGDASDTNTDVLEPDRTGPELVEGAELEKQDQPSEQSEKD